LPGVRRLLPQAGGLRKRALALERKPERKQTMKKPTGQDEARDRRAARLAAELRANLQRRKAQARARREGAADERQEGIAAAGGDQPGKPVKG